MQFRECDDGEGAKGNCYRRLQWPERFDLIHVAMLLFSRGGRCPACCRGAAAPWLDLGGASSGSVVKKIVRVGGWSPPNSECGDVRPVACAGARGGWARWCGGRRRRAGGYLLPMGPLAPSGDVRRRRGHFCAVGDDRRRWGPESCPRTRRMSPSGTARTWPRGMSPAALCRAGSGGGAATRGRGVVCLGLVVVRVFVLMWWLVRWIRLGLRGRCVGRLLLLD